MRTLSYRHLLITGGQERWSLATFPPSQTHSSASDIHHLTRSSSPHCWRSVTQCDRGELCVPFSGPITQLLRAGPCLIHLVVLKPKPVAAFHKCLLHGKRQLPLLFARIYSLKLTLRKIDGHNTLNCSTQVTTNIDLLHGFL